MLRSVNRTLSFFVKWLAEVVRQPGLMLSLIVGPFIILLAFGQGVKLGAPRPRTILVEPPAAAATQNRIAPVVDDLNQYLTIVGQTANRAAAQKQLEQGKTDLVAVLPPDPLADVRAGRRATVEVLTDDIDPVRQSYTRTYLREQVASLNQKTVQKAIEDAQGSAGETQTLITQMRGYLRLARMAQGDAGEVRRQVTQLKTATDRLAAAAGRAGTAAEGATFVVPGLERPLADLQELNRSVDSLKRNVDSLDAQLAPGGAVPPPSQLDQIDADLTSIERTVAQVQSIPAWVLSAPFEAELKNVVPKEPTYIAFYAPAVLALLLQHLAITLGALSMARIRLLGLMELLQTSPVRPAEAVVGNYLSYGMLCAVAGGVLLGLIVLLLGVPVFGSYLVLGGMMALLVLCALGIGFIISMISSSEQQAAQLAMLILIATVFFSGFVVPVSTLAWPVRAISYALPATYAIRTFQDEMLRGVLRTPADLAVLAIAAVLFFLFTVTLFRREYRPR